MRTTTTLAVTMAAVLAGAAVAPSRVVAQATATLAVEVPLGLDLYLPAPPGNRLTVDKVALGRRLFFDKRISADGTMSCATCHEPARAFTDGRRVAEGVFGRRGARNVPTLINRAYGASHFLDGRSASLEDQVLQPIESDNELGYDVQQLVASLREDPDYRSAFEQNFGRAPDAVALAHALASFVRTLLAGNAPVDRYLAGEREALTDEELAGMRLFVGRARCSACHVGANFTDEDFHNTGVAWRPGTDRQSSTPAVEFSDVGRFAITGEPSDLGAFKTPTLREIGHTAPYMHDGSMATLEEVVDFYNRGGAANRNLDRRIRPLGLAPADKVALVSFLNALSGTVQEGGR